jgi:hypothetical protein
MGITIDDDVNAAPSPAAKAHYKQQFHHGVSRNQQAGLASLYGWSLPSDIELEASALAADSPLVVSGRQ